MSQYRWQHKTCRWGISFRLANFLGGETLGEHLVAVPVCQTRVGAAEGKASGDACQT